MSRSEKIEEVVKEEYEVIDRKESEMNLSREEIEKEVQHLMNKCGVVMTEDQTNALCDAVEKTGVLSKDLVMGFSYGLEKSDKSKKLIEEASCSFISKVKDLSLLANDSDRVIWSALNISEEPNGGGIKDLKWEINFGFKDEDA